MTKRKRKPKRKPPAGYWWLKGEPGEKNGWRIAVEKRPAWWRRFLAPFVVGWKWEEAKQQEKTK